MKIFEDYHTHTNYSHGTGTPEQNVCAAIEKGLSRIAITEHSGGHYLFGVRGEKLCALRREVDRLASRYANDIDVLFGMECNLTAFGECDAPERASCDVLLLAYHKGVWPHDGLALSCAMEAMHLRKANPKIVAQALLAAADKYKIDIFSHPCLYVACDMDILSRGAAQLGVAIELNGSRLSMSDEQILTAAGNGAKLIINSDAHRPERVGEGECALTAAHRCAIEDKIVNIR
ncbi:MAG: PHP domain-containing protein [Clostridia bacterium]